jgi:hypothetical protein
MPSAAVEYLEAAKIEELTGKLRAEGWDVQSGSGSGVDYDLIAKRGKEVVAYEVKARSRLSDFLPVIEQLRQRASREGITSFRVVVVNPPRTIDVHVHGLADVLRDYLAESLPANLARLSASTEVHGVHGLELDRVDVSDEGTHVVGAALVDVDLNYPAGPGYDELTTSSGIPFQFDVLLSSDLSDIRALYALQVDTSIFGD